MHTGEAQKKVHGNGTRYGNANAVRKIGAAAVPK